MAFRRKELPKSRELWISGVNPVREALRSSVVVSTELVAARSGFRVREILDLAAARKVPVRQEDRDAITALVGHGHHQGVALQVSEFPYADLDDLLSKPLAQIDPVVVLDCIQDPQNLGALIRSACFLGAKALVIPADRSARMTDTVVKVSVGAASILPIVRVTNLTRALERLKEAGLWIVGLDVTGAGLLHETELTLPVALVVGNEEKGLRPLVRKTCDFAVRIPAGGEIESLNAATAGALALYEVQRQRAIKTS